MANCCVGVGRSRYAVEWFTTLFTVSAPPELALAALDLMLAQARDDI